MAHSVQFNPGTRLSSEAIPLLISSSPLLLSPFFPESRTKAIDVKLSKMNLATCVTYGAGRRGGWGQATTTPPGSFVTQP